ncbi:MAG: response regulator [Pseudomonadota bacterium]
MIVDDQADNREILRRRMTRQGHEAVIASSGDEALSAIERAVPDLVLLDYMMPGMSGLEVLIELRTRFDRSRLPIIMVTARSDDSNVAECIAAGANDYVAKPISFPVLTARVDAQLERRDAAIALEDLNRELEDKIAQRTTELVAHNKALIEAHQTLEKSDRAKSLFLATMSHEMRTPLNSIIGLSEIMRNEIHGPFSAPQYLSYVSEIRKSGGYLLELVTDIMDNIAMSAGPDGIESQVFDALAALAEAITLIDSAKPDQPSRIDLSTDGAAFPMEGDHSRLRRAFINIIGNALKFSAPDEQVEIRTRRSDGWLALDILDRGPGIPSEKLDEVMAPFIQIYNPGEVKQKGIGLGLSIANDIVRAHGGTIALRNRPDGGLCVEMRLPAKAEDRHSDAQSG